MNITLAIILVVAIGLIIFSYMKQLEQEKNLEKQIDHVTFLVTDELYKMNQIITNVQLDLEITTNEEKTIQMNDEARELLKKIIIMQRSGYSSETIAQQFSLEENEIIELLLPYKEMRKDK